MNENGQINQMLHERIYGFWEQSKSLYSKMIEHSDEYKRALGLSGSDMVILMQMQGKAGVSFLGEEKGKTGFLTIAHDRNTYALIVSSICGSFYGGEWSDEVVALCISAPELNNKIGAGSTSYISIVSDEAHKAILDKIARGEYIKLILGSDSGPQLYSVDYEWERLGDNVGSGLLTKIAAGNEEEAIHILYDQTIDYFTRDKSLREGDVLKLRIKTQDDRFIRTIRFTKNDLMRAQERSGEDGRSIS